MEKLPNKVFLEWQAYSHIDPFGNERLDLIAGIIASTTANVHRGKNDKPFKASDFMPDWRSQEEKLQHRRAELEMQAWFQRCMNMRLEKREEPANG